MLTKQTILLLEISSYLSMPLSSHLQVRFYAGAPLAIPDCCDGTKQVSLGTLCLIDTKPRTFKRHEITRLCQYANDVREEILRRDNSYKEEEEEGW